MSKKEKTITWTIRIKPSVKKKLQAYVKRMPMGFQSTGGVIEYLFREKN